MVKAIKVDNMALDIAISNVLTPAEYRLQRDLESIFIASTDIKGDNMPINKIMLIATNGLLKEDNPIDTNILINMIGGKTIIGANLISLKIIFRSLMSNAYNNELLNTTLDTLLLVVSTYLKVGKTTLDIKILAEDLKRINTIKNHIDVTMNPNNLKSLNKII